MIVSFMYFVVPAQAGTHASAIFPVDEWIPAFAGMTVRTGTTMRRHRMPSR
jgi:hypothetical protein